MADKYSNYKELAAAESEGVDFRIICRPHGTETAIVAPHGGAIEPGTSEIAAAVAADDLSFYAFEGIKPNRNGELHITSTRFDEPSCIALIQSATRVITIHGEASDQEVAFLGGLDKALGDLIGASLAARGFQVQTHTDASLQGQDLSNICNRGKSNAGVQLELSRGLRQSFFATLDREGRSKATPHFAKFVAAVRKAL